MNKFIIRGNISNRVLSLIYLFPSSPPSSFDFSISTFSLLPDANLRISSLKVRRENTVYSKLDVLRLVTFPPIPTNAYEVCITIVPPLWRQANESPLRITFSLPSPPPPSPPLCVENRLEADATRSMNRCARLTALYNTSAGLFFSRFHSGLKNFLLARHWINCFSSQRSLNNLRVYVGSWLNAKVKTVVWEIYYDQDITQLIKICLPQFCRSKWIHGSLSVGKRGKKGYRYVK